LSETNHADSTGIIGGGGRCASIGRRCVMAGASTRNGSQQPDMPRPPLDNGSGSTITSARSTPPTARVRRSFRPQQFRQLSNIHGNAPRFIEGQHLGDVSLLTGISCVDVDEGLAGSIQHLEAARYLLDLPGRFSIRLILATLALFVARNPSGWCATWVVTHTLTSRQRLSSLATTGQVLASFACLYRARHPTLLSPLYV
jgi:hypothetical protein